MTPREIGIMFKPWGILGLLGRYKRSTMRVIGPPSHVDDADRLAVEDGVVYAWHGRTGYGLTPPFGPVGTVFYAKETFRVLTFDNTSDIPVVELKADSTADPRILCHNQTAIEQARRYASSGAWKSPRFMPKWAARPNRWRITKIPPIPANDTTEEIARGEGFERVLIGQEKWWKYNDMLYVFALSAWRVAIEEIHPGILDKNKWMWLYDFEEVTT